MKIAFIVPTLESHGGVKRITIEKANYFSIHFGYDVFIITQYHHNDKPIIYPISEKVHYIHLGIPYFKQYSFKYPRRLWIKRTINKRLRKETTNAVLRIDPDILIGFSFFRPDIVCKIPCRAIKIIESHEPKDLLESNLYNKSMISKLFRKIHIRTIEKHADLVIGLTNDAKKQWEKAKRVEVIPNYSSMTVSRQSDSNAKRVIAVGRLTYVKGFERLIKIWEIVSTKHPDWLLDIFGDGPLKDKLTKLISASNLNNIKLHEAVQNISQEYANSSICAVSSYYEGFSLVILEAMMHGVPCIAFDCPDGPRSIITDNKNGFLVQNGNNSMFAERLCQLMENDIIRSNFSKNCLEDVKQFDTDKIMEHWKDLFESLIKSKRNNR